MITGAWSVAWVLLAAGPAAAQGVPDDDVIFWKSKKLELPIAVNAARQKDMRELELYYSTNQGVNWNLAAKAAPTQDAFRFTAPTDGLYWFTVLSYDLRGNPEPPSPQRAQQRQKVLFDTRPPDVRLISAERKGDSVVVRWDVSDDYLNLSTLHIDYQLADGTQPWVAVPATQERTGSAVFQCPAAVTVRVSVSDMAKNTGTAEAKVPAAAGTVTAAKPAEVSSDVPALPPPSGSAPAPNVGPPAPVASGTTVPPVASHGVAGEASTTSAGAVAKTSEGPPAPPQADAVQPVSASSTPPARSSLTPGGVEELSPAPPALKETTPGGVVASSPTPGGPAGAPAALPGMAADKDIGLQIINTRRVTMEYEVAKVGPSGVGSVDLYVTRDGGLKWNRVEGEHGVAATPPGGRPGEVMRRTISVDLPSDGVYGFYLVVKSGAGLGTAPPKDGTAPQMRVEVDTTAPEALLYGPQPSASQNDVLVLSWKATDNRLAVNPITLQWAERKEGEWHCIGEPQMPNTSSFNWRVPTTVPPKVYLRLTVRDAAGNAAVAETKEPVLVDLSVPVPRLIGLVRGGGQ